MSSQVSPPALPDPARIESVPPSPVSTVDQLHAEINRLKQIVTNLTDTARLQEQIRDLSQVVAARDAELEMYRRAAEAWAAAQITEADIDRYARDEPGVPLEAFIGELEQIQGDK